MNRDYSSGTAQDITFFIGDEIEHTPAYGQKTLFVTGVQSIDSINQILINFKDITHVFFGANHSFNPKTYDEWNEWEKIILHFLNAKYLCSLDIPLSVVEQFNDTCLNEHNNFIPQIRVPIPYIKLWNYNTMIKIDDINFNATNPGVWTHSLHQLQDRSKFTPWSKYSNDVIVK